MLRWLTLFALHILLLFQGVAHASDSGDPVEVKVIHEERSIQPGKPFWVALYVKLDENWHIYWKNPGDTGIPPSIEWRLPEGFKSSPTLWPVPKQFKWDGLVGYGYEDEVIFLAEITPPEALTTSQPAQLEATVSWLACSESTCMPGESVVKATLPISKEPPAPADEWTHLFNKYRSLAPASPSALSAKQEGDTLHIQFAVPGGLQHDGAEVAFYPEENKVVDPKTPPTLMPHPELEDHYLLSFNTLTPPETLKGVAHIKAGSTEHILAIDASIVSTPSELAPAGAEVSGLMAAILLALLGGTILNLMPCVLPVMSFKVLSFVKLAGEDRLKTLKHGLFFSLGVLVSFWTLAGVLLALQAYGHAVGWGFQLQEPIFVAILAALLFAFSLSLFGVFEAGQSLTNLAGRAQGVRREGLFSSFLSGVLATALATPCTGPFLGSAVGFAVTAPAFAAFAIFTALGLGMAAPYLVLAGFPKLLRFIPKPGQWMVIFKELMGFVILATVLWLLWVFNAQTNGIATLFLIASFFVLAVGCWLLGKGAGALGKVQRWSSRACVLLCLLLAGALIKTASSPTTAALQNSQIAMEETEWESFSPQRVAELQSEGKAVLIDFTAKWCLICQVNKVALSSTEVDQLCENLGVVRMKADWTKNDPTITQELRKHGRSGVPLYLLYSKKPGEAPQVLPQVLTSDLVVQYLKGLES